MKNPQTANLQISCVFQSTKRKSEIFSAKDFHQRSCDCEPSTLPLQHGLHAGGVGRAKDSSSYLLISPTFYSFLRQKK
jgi:hypothetical protein